MSRLATRSSYVASRPSWRTCQCTIRTRGRAAPDRGSQRLVILCPTIEAGHCPTAARCLRGVGENRECRSPSALRREFPYTVGISCSCLTRTGGAEEKEEVGREGYGGRGSEARTREIRSEGQEGELIGRREEQGRLRGATGVDVVPFIGQFRE